MDRRQIVLRAVREIMMELYEDDRGYDPVLDNICTTSAYAVLFWAITALILDEDIDKVTEQNVYSIWRERFDVIKVHVREIAYDVIDYDDVEYPMHIVFNNDFDITEERMEFGKNEFAFMFVQEEMPLMTD